MQFACDGQKWIYCLKSHLKAFCLITALPVHSKRMHGLQKYFSHLLQGTLMKSSADVDFDVCIVCRLP